MSRGGAGSPGRSARVLVGAVLLDAAATLPVGLTGAVAVQLNEDLGLADQQLGFVAAGFFGCGALTALLTLRLVDRIGWRRSVLIATCITTAATILSAFAFGGAVGFALAITAAGAGLAIMMPATNLMLVSLSTDRYLALMIAVKQASVPLALLLAGSAVPVLVVGRGWEITFALAATMAPAGIALLWSLGAGARRGPPAGVSGAHLDGRQARGLTFVGLGVGLTSALAGALTAYLVLSLVRSGMAATDAAVLYAVANGAGMAVRLACGWYATRWATDGYGPVALLMAAGGLGAMLLGGSQPVLLVLAACLAFGFGWGWPGLLFFAVMRSNPGSPAAASSVVQSGGMAGAAAGPLLAGWMAGWAGWSLTWVIIGLGAMLGGVSIHRAGRLLAASDATVRA